MTTNVRKFERAGSDTCRWVDVDSRGEVEWGSETTPRNVAILGFLESLDPADVYGIHDFEVYYRRSTTLRTDTEPKA